jgi:metallo-beta-lactamase family protein
MGTSHGAQATTLSAHDKIPSHGRTIVTAFKKSLGVEIEFSGAAREVTGSCHILRVDGKTVLLDCGMFQGHRGESREKNLKLPCPVEAIEAVVLSHAHIDHAGRLPVLTRAGYRGTIYCTPATRDLSAVMLADSAYIQEKDAEFLARRTRERVEPLYNLADATAAVEQMVGIPYHKPFDVIPGVRATYVDAGHILGSASVVLDCTSNEKSRRLIFSADIGRPGLPIIRDPEPPNGGADAVIMESTYGDRDHPPVEDMRDRLATIVRETAAKGGRVLIPAFAVGRTQEIVYDLHVLAREKRIPSIPIYIDSPLAIDATSVFAMHPDEFDRGEDLVRTVRELFQFDLVHYTRDVSESKALNAVSTPMVVIAASGMAESGRIVHHLGHGAPDPRNTILVVGFMAEHTLGRRIVERRSTLKIFGEEVPLRARVEILNGYSAHGDRNELMTWLGQVRRGGPKAPRVWLVHGEPPAQEALGGRLRERGYQVGVPSAGTKAEL